MFSNIVTFGMKNKVSDLSVKISYENKNLPYFLQWKMIGTDEYVCGLEPGNSPVCGRHTAREEGKLQTIAPGQSVDYKLEINVGEYDKF